MIFNKDSKLIKVSAHAEAYYSGAEAYGDIFIPYEMYEDNKEKLDELSVTIFELDGKHSETDCEIEFEEYTIVEILRTKVETYDQGQDISTVLYEAICYELEFTEEQEYILDEFNNDLWKLDRFYDYINTQVTLSKDTKIEGTVVPKGTVISFNKRNDITIPEDWSFNFPDMDILLAI